MQQSSATPKNKDVGRGLRKIVACSQPYLAVLSCIYSFWHGVIPTSYLIFTLVSLIFSSHRYGKRHPSLNCTRMRMWYVRKENRRGLADFRIIRESVDSLCRDDADMPRPPYIRRAYNRPNVAFVSLFR